MATALSEILRFKRVSIAVIIKCHVHGQVHGNAIGTAMYFHGTKTPEAILIRHGDVTSAFEIGGAPIQSDDLDRRYAAQRLEFERLVGEDVRSDG